MSLRPIDLQVILNQMGEVSRREKNRQDKKNIKKDEAIRRSQDINSQQSNVKDVDKIEMDIGAKKDVESVANKKDLEKKKKNEKEEINDFVESKFKGNFVDLRE